MIQTEKALMNKHENLNRIQNRLFPSNSITAIESLNTNVELNFGQKICLKKVSKKGNLFNANISSNSFSEQLNFHQF